MIDELFEQQGQSIFSFKKGDIIIRIKPAIIKETQYNDNLGITTEVAQGEDHSFREPLEFIGISNNLIYMRCLKGWNKGNVMTGRLERFCEGWEHFKLPEGLTLEDYLK